jgi:hypothetical protein
MEKPWFDRLENDQTIVAFPLHTSVKRRARGQGGGYALEAVGGHLAHSSSREPLGLAAFRWDPGGLHPAVPLWVALTEPI